MTRLCFSRSLLATACAIAPVAHAATITVTSAADGTAVNGVVTLREALASQNAAADLNADVTAARVGAYGVGDTIHFAVGSGALTLAPVQALPVIVRAVSIDGSTQPGATRVAIDGTSAGSGADGLRVTDALAVTLNALDVVHFSGTGIRVGGTLEYGLFADGFETAGGGRPGAAEVSAPLTLLDVALGQNGVGLRIDAGVVQVARTSVAASTSDGIQVEPGGTLTLNDGAPQPALSVQQNRGYGVRVRGAVTRASPATGFDVGYNGDHGILIDTDGAVAIGASLIHDNGVLGGALPARHGVMIQRAGSTAAIVVDGQRPTLRSTTRIEYNTGGGVHIAASAIAAGATVSVGDVDISFNAIGVYVDVGNGGRYLQVADVDVYQNSGNGMLFRSAPSMFRDAATTPPLFAQNKVHSNALNQIVLAGGTYYVNSPSDACDAGANAVYCNSPQMAYGIFAQDSANVFVEHTSFENGGQGLRDWGAQAGSTMSVSSSCAAITVCP